MGLVPKRRLGKLLAERRDAYGYDVRSMARRSRGRFSAAQLEVIEAGGASLDDADIESLSLLYEFNSTPPRAQRSKLIVTTDEEMPAEFAPEHFDEALVYEVLQRYVAMLYLLRTLPVGQQLPLRKEDLETLGAAFSTTEAWLVENLNKIMVDDTVVVLSHVDRMRRRLVVPAAGLLVGPTPAGMLVLVK